MFFKVIACEIVLREICFLAAQSPHLVDLEFLPQGYHDDPPKGRGFLQQHINAVPPGKYDAILLGYGLCGNIITGLKANHTRLVIPRAHDCITFFLGSNARYQNQLEQRPGAYYYTAGWLEVLIRRGEKTAPESTQFLPTRAGAIGNVNRSYDEWVKKYGVEQAQYLMEVMDQWTGHYTHGVLSQYDFTKVLALREEVQCICASRGWEFEELEGDLRLLRHWLNGEWQEEFLIVQPGEEVVPSYDAHVITTRKTME
jgi:hypothetical protein